MIDTHSHIYSDDFDSDLSEVINRAKENNVTHIVLPNIDRFSLQRMLHLEAQYPGYCHAAIGLHPTSIKDDYEYELKLVHSELKRKSYIAVGEIGIDLYWDKSFLEQQSKAFKKQIDWALEYNLPVIIHVRESFNETMQILNLYKGKELRGVFHSFTGTAEQALEIIKFDGFKLGINGIVTYKNSTLPTVLKDIPLEYILLETDSPYLTPVPFRGKRNESAYVKYVCGKLSEIYNISVEEIDKKTTINAKQLFAIK